jgi:hypothetical protein
MHETPTQPSPIQSKSDPIQCKLCNPNRTRKSNDETKKTIVTCKETNKAATKLLRCRSWRLPAHPVTPARAAP